MPKYLPQHSIPEHPLAVFFPYVGDQVSHPYNTAGKTLVMAILIFKLLEANYSRLNGQAFPEFTLLLVIVVSESIQMVMK
jgi:hypothetical protein